MGIDSARFLDMLVLKGMKADAATKELAMKTKQHLSEKYPILT